MGSSKQKSLLSKNTLPDPKQLILSLPAKRRKDLDALFHGDEQGFYGADGDLSMPIGKGRSLWLFGDVIVGSRDDIRSFELPRNSVGILNRNRKGTFKFKYYWRVENGRAKSFFPTPKAGEWLWPGVGCMINNKLYFFLHRFQTNNKKKYEAMRFRYVGFCVIRVANPQDAPDLWSLEFLSIPKPCHSVFWGNACFLDKDGFLYLWGASYGHRKKGTVMVRCPIEYLEKNKGKGWEYFVQCNPNPFWSYKSHSLYPLFSDRATEMSLCYLKKQKIFIVVYGGRRRNSIGIRISKDLKGPWSPYREIYDPPEYKWNKHYFCYAPKAHPEMSSDDNELLVTYITNSLYVKDVFKDKRIYYPKFISLKLKDCLSNK